MKSMREIFIVLALERKLKNLLLLSLEDLIQIVTQISLEIFQVKFMEQFEATVAKQLRRILMFAKLIRIKLSKSLVFELEEVLRIISL